MKSERKYTTQSGTGASAGRDAWFKHVVEACAASDYHVTPVYADRPPKPYKHSQTYTDLRLYRSASAVGVVLEDVVLVDYDGNKARADGKPIMPVDDLAALLGLEAMPIPVQRNEYGDSLHWLFSLPPDVDTNKLRQSMDGWHEYIDIKTGNQLVHLKPEKTLTGGQLPDYDQLPQVPKPLLDALTTKRKGSAATSAAVQALPTVVLSERVNEVKQLLDRFPKRLSANEWFTVMQGVNKHTLGAAEGLVAFTRFSARWCLDADELSENADTWARRWNSLDPFTTEGVTFASVVWLAEQHDPKNVLQRALLDEYIYVIEQDRFMGASRGLIEKSGLNGKHAHETKGGAPASRRFLEDPKATKVDNLTWVPSNDRIIHEGGRRLANTYLGPEIEPIKGDISPWLDHLNYLVKEPATREHLVKWLAFCVQFPELKINHQLLLGGPPRVGKDTLLQPLIAAVGDHNVYQLAADQLKSQFNQWAAQSKLVIIQEIADFDNMALENKLKPLCTAPPDTLEVNTKGTKQYSIPNVVSLIFLTNDRQPFPIQKGNERFFAVWCDVERRSDDYYKELYDWLAENMAKVVYYLKYEVDLSGFNRGARPPLTPWASEINEFSVSDTHMTLRGMIESETPPFNRDIVTLNDVCLSTGVKGKTLTKVLADMGCISVKAQRKANGKTNVQRAWIVRNHSKYSQLRPTDLYDLI